MKCFSFLFILILFCSCSRFHIPHYRHVKKVPAIRQSISEVAEKPQAISDTQKRLVCNVAETENAEEQNVTFVVNDSIRSANGKSYCNEPSKIPDADRITRISDKNDSSVTPVVFNARRDWSVLVALIFIFCGFLLLIWSIAIIAALPAAFWIRLLIGIGMIPLAVKLILRGAGILLARIRQPSNYKESGY